MTSIYEIARLIVDVEDDDDIIVSWGNSPFIFITHIGSIAGITFNMSEHTVWETLSNGNVVWLDSEKPQTWWNALGLDYKEK